jgi:hypothetical protein
MAGRRSLFRVSINMALLAEGGDWFRPVSINMTLLAEGDPKVTTDLTRLDDRSFGSQFRGNGWCGGAAPKITS